MEGGGYHGEGCVMTAVQVAGKVLATVEEASVHKDPIQGLGVRLGVRITCQAWCSMHFVRSGDWDAVGRWLFCLM
jgi:hypothetical protein